MFILAHGERWDMAASRAVTDLVQKVLQKQDKTTQEAQDNGTFGLLYTPTDTKRKSFKVSLPKSPKTPDNQRQNGAQFINESKNSGVQRF